MSNAAFTTIIIGGGAGGLSLGALLSRQQAVLLLEKARTVGGCATTFRWHGFLFPTGATTVAGFGEHMPLPQLLRDVELTSSVAFDFHHPGMWLSGEDGWSLGRWQNFEQFLGELQAVFPHPENERFWREVYRINDFFWQHWQQIRYHPHSLGGLLRTAMSISPLLRAFPRALVARADRVIEKLLPNISLEYRQFLDAQMLIAVQARASEVSFASAALALGYTFTGVATPVGGMGALPDALASRITQVQCASPVTKIQRKQEQWIVSTPEGDHCASRIILNAALESVAELFTKGSRESMYFARANRRFTGVGAFVTYFVVTSTNPLPPHHQHLARTVYPHAASSALFFSASPASEASEQRGFTVSASLHVDAEYWIRLSSDRKRYVQAKSELEARIVATFERLFPQTSIEKIFSATPKTYRHYTGRATVGGIPATRSHQWHYPSSCTPFPNLFRVGDTTFPGQGWPGVIMGAYQAWQAIESRS